MPRGVYNRENMKSKKSAVKADAPKAGRKPKAVAGDPGIGKGIVKEASLDGVWSVREAIATLTNVRSLNMSNTTLNTKVEGLLDKAVEKYGSLLFPVEPPVDQTSDKEEETETEEKETNGVKVAAPAPAPVPAPAAAPVAFNPPPFVQN